MKSYERRFVVEYLELHARISNLEEFIERLNLGQEESKCDVGILIMQLNTMRKYRAILEMRADLEELDLQEARL